MIRNIAAQVEHQVRFNPTAVSVIDTRVSLTYQQLWCRVLDISRSLQCAGVRPEENVGVLLPRCTDLVAAVLAVVWPVLWWRHFRRRPEEAAASSELPVSEEVYSDAQFVEGTKP